jgi:hypothetical protein
MVLHMQTGKGFEHRHVRIIGGDDTVFMGREHKGKFGTVMGIVLFQARRANRNSHSWLSEWNRVMTLLTGGERIWDGAVVQVNLNSTPREQAVEVEIEHLYDAW